MGSGFQIPDVSRYKSEALASADFVTQCGSLKDAADLNEACPARVRSTSLYRLKTTHT